ncbi:MULTISPECIES: hypothetical protein [unclassified Pseudomonas]|nr:MULTISPECIES: hypothetical protein [unclassified Pseudomonas]MEB0040108.1 hypothetical protein [Pseudomonas sp. MH10]MEB0078431.1 hypothetical protein [Pseudomonas sp. MH10out]MEB0090163.1 hypothetical protein [Pseudomonas sp. CCI4.2]MEB0102903.1 hypothetical protein [Pseudomonas sp. CCI3.2]MEB0122283.1 hypothetical protein [Pseudomonas sp. CCI1.2]
MSNIQIGMFALFAIAVLGALNFYLDFLRTSKPKKDKISAPKS